MIYINEINNIHIENCFLLDSETLKMWNIEQWAQEISKMNTKAFGIFENKKLIGVCVFQKVISEAEVTFLTIHPNHQRKGFGEKLINHLLTICEKENIRRIILEVSYKNKEALYFYEKCGFKTIGLRRKYYRDGSDAILKEKEV